MKVEVEEVSPVQRKLWIEVPFQDVEEKLGRAYRALGKKAKVKGFRPGKAPRSILERLYRKQVEEEVSQDLLRHSLSEALEEVKLRPVMLRMPERVPVLVPGDGFKFSVELEIAPDFTVENYLGLTVTATEVEVTEAMINQRLEEIRELNAWLKPIAADRPIQSGDYVSIGYESWLEGELVTGGGSENQHLQVGAGKFYPEFEQHLIGLRRGQEASFRLDVPPDFFNPALAGKTVDFQVKIHEISEKELPALDDEFAKALGGNFQSLEDLRQAVKQDIIKKVKQQQEVQLHNQVIDQLLRQTSFEVPPSLIRQEQQRLLRDQLEALYRRGLNLAGLDQEKMLESLRDLAERRARIHLIMDKIADQEGITVSDAEIEAGYQRMAALWGEPVERLKELFREHQREAELKRQVREDKTIQMLLDQANVVAPSASAETAEEGT